MQVYVRIDPCNVQSVGLCLLFLLPIILFVGILLMADAVELRERAKNRRISKKQLIEPSVICSLLKFKINEELLLAHSDSQPSKISNTKQKGIQMEMKEDDLRCYDTSVLSRSFERGGLFLQKYKADEKWAVVSPMTHHVIRDQTTPPPVPIRRQRSRSFGDYVDMRPSEITLLLPPMKPHHEESKNSPHHQNSQQIPKTRVTKNKSLVKKGNPIWISVMYGLINATIVLPVVMSFGNIIYQNEFFEILIYRFCFKN